MGRFEDEVGRQNLRTIGQLRNYLDLSWLRYKDYRIINTEESYQWFLNEIKQYILYGCDTETTGLMIANLSKNNPLKDHMVGLSLSWKKNQGVYIPFDHTQFANMDKKRVLRDLLNFFETRQFVTHNGLFDGKVFYDEGIKLNIVHDTLAIANNLDCNSIRFPRDLKSIIKRRYGIDVIEFSDIFPNSKSYGLFRYVSEEIAKAYACADADFALQLLMDSFVELTVGQRNAYSLDVQLLRNLIRMEYNGKGIDIKLCHKLAEVNAKDLDTLAECVYKYTHYCLCKQNNIEYTEGQYRFNIGSSDEVGDLFYNKLKYKIIKKNDKTGNPSVDTFVFEAMIKEEAQSNDPVELDIVHTALESSLKDAGFSWPSKKDLILVDLKEYSSTKYKLPYLISLWRRLEKLRSSFFSPLINNNYEGRYFSSIKMYTAKTARIIDNIQTLDSYLKRLVTAYDPETQMVVDYDYSQIEARCMIGLSGTVELVDRLDNPENDYHRESGESILNKPPEDITKDERDLLKPVNFGIPYGMSKRGIVRAKFGIGLTKQEMKEALEVIADILTKWTKGMWKVAKMLDKYRKQAITPIPDSEKPSHLKGIPCGKVTNPTGRSRIFYLDRMDGQTMSDSEIASMERQGGNYPIQSFAREIFCRGLINLCNRLVKDGHMDIRVPDESTGSGYRLESKFMPMALIHDEVLSCASRELDPNYLQMCIREECMQKLEGHPEYFCGAGVVDNWYEGKGDLYAAPVRMIDEQIVEMKKHGTLGYTPDKNAKEFVLKQIADYMIRRSTEEVLKFAPDVLTTRELYVEDIVPRFKNYFVKPQFLMHQGLWRKTYVGPKKDEVWKDAYGPNEHTYVKALIDHKELAHDDFTLAIIESIILKNVDYVDVVFASGFRIRAEKPADGEYVVILPEPDDIPEEVKVAVEADSEEVYDVLYIDYSRIKPIGTEHEINAINKMFETIGAMTNERTDLFQ